MWLVLVWAAALWCHRMTQNPELIRPAEHICYLKLTLRFCLVNILAAISALLIFIMEPVSCEEWSHIVSAAQKKWINLTNVDNFSPVYVYRINIGWQISLHRQFAELVGSGLKTSRISSWQWDGHNVPNLLTQEHLVFHVQLFCCPLMMGIILHSRKVSVTKQTNIQSRIMAQEPVGVQLE